jgi:hypothetical protein
LILRGRAVACFLLLTGRSIPRRTTKEMTAMRKILWICALAAGATLFQLVVADPNDPQFP